MADFDIAGANLPYSLDAEQSVLGAILLDSAANMPKATAKLTAEHFYVQLHSDIFAVMSQMFARSEIIDIVTVLENCLNRAESGKDGYKKKSVFESPEEGRTYLVKLMETVPSISSIDRYIEIIEERYTRRQLITIAEEILDNANNGADSTSSLLELAEKRIYEVRNENQVRGLTKINGIVVSILNELSEMCSNPDKQGQRGLKSGFPTLDKYIYGLNGSDLLIIAARPGMGKTSFAMNIATNVAKYHPEKAVCVFNLEMSKEQLVTRMLSSEGRISSDLMKTGKFDPAQWRNLADASLVLSNMNIYIDDSSAITVNEMKAKLRRIDNLGLVVIDYLQLISSGRRDLNRVNEISEMTRNLKIMAKELNVPVITLSQLARSAEKKDDKRPMLSDLRDSGSIEQDADIVLFLYRDSYYNKDTEDQRACKCIIAKNRHGETNDINMMWDGQYTRFTDTEYVHAER